MAGPLARGAGRSAFEVERAWATTGGDLMAGWDRIEAIARSTGLTGGLEARVADPLWLLARQWQVGEFHGDDGWPACCATAACPPLWPGPHPSGSPGRLLRSCAGVTWSGPVPSWTAGGRGTAVVAESTPSRAGTTSGWSTPSRSQPEGRAMRSRCGHPSTTAP